jgi:uncharacterized protein YkwD
VLLRRALMTLALSLALVAPAVASAPPASAATSVQQVVKAINAARKAHGLPALKLKADLNRYAGKHTRAMAARHRLYHSSMKVPGRHRGAAENVAYGGSVAQIQSMLMASPGHRANILNRAYNHVGIGVRYSGGVLWVTQVFRDPR